MANHSNMMDISIKMDILQGMDFYKNQKEHMKDNLKKEKNRVKESINMQISLHILVHT